MFNKLKNCLILFSCVASIALLAYSCNIDEQETARLSAKANPELSPEEWLDSLMLENEKILKDTLQSSYHFNKGAEYLLQYADAETYDEASVLLELACESYKKGVKIGTEEPFAVFYCGLLTEKIGDKESAKNYYTLAFELAKDNLLMVDEHVNKELGEFYLLTAREKDSLYSSIASNYKSAQNFSIGLSQIMLGNKEVGINHIKSVERESPIVAQQMKLFGSYYKREDILNWIARNEN